MTVQIETMFKYNDAKYPIIRQSGPLGFDPIKYGITPEAIFTACWNGFWCEYNIMDDKFYLENLYINSKDGYYPKIEGVLPQFDEEHDIGHHSYKGLNIRIPYTGKILGGREFMSRYIFGIGHKLLWGYNVLTEFIFENGVLLEVNDQSEIAADIRERMIAEDRAPLNYPKEFEAKAWWLGPWPYQ